MFSSRAVVVITDALFTGAGVISTEAIRLVKNGAVSGKAHVPSKPGDPPNADTHVLDRSIHAEKAGKLKAKAVADAPYALALELGTSRMAARPYMKPATAAKRALVTKNVQEANFSLIKGP